MQYLTATIQYLQQIKQLWLDNFDDGTPDFADYLFDSTDINDIYIGIENEKVVCMLIAATELEYKNRKGFYLYSACATEEYRGKGYMHGLVDFALKDRKSKGKDFCVVQPATQQLFSFWSELGFDNIVTLRKCDIEIKRNIWQNRDFDIITASRFAGARSKFCEENLIHYTKKSYEKYTGYMYTWSGSTVETEDGYRVYFTENNKLVVKELFAAGTLAATKLLQAVRERTGFETAMVYLPENSTLFLGEGKKEDIFAIYGLDEDVYVNLMFE